MVLVVDEFADLIMTAGKEGRNPIARLAQLLQKQLEFVLLATQRPSSKCYLELLKLMIAFKCQKIDSRTIIDSGETNQLIGR